MRVLVLGQLFCMLVARYGVNTTQQPVRVVDEKILEVFDNVRVGRILRQKCDAASASLAYRPKKALLVRLRCETS